MKTNSLIFAFASLALLFTACSEEQEQSPAKNIQLSTESIVDLPATESVQEITITTDGTWTSSATDSDMILKITPSEGGAVSGQKVQISISANKGKNRSAVVTFGSSKLNSKSLTISQFGEKGDSDAEKITVADFLSKKDTKTAYQLEGTISGLSNSSFKGFDLTDGTGTVTVAFPDNFDEYADTLENGGTAVVEGVYAYYEAKGTHQLDGKIVSYKAVEHKVINTDVIAEVLVAADGDEITLTNVTVIAKYNKGYMVTDGKDYVLVFNNAEVDAVPGDVVDIVGKKNVHGGLPQIDTPTTTIKSHGDAPAFPQAEDITESFDDFNPGKFAFVTFKGTLAKSGNYYNVTVAGATKTGSISYPLSSLGLDGMDKMSCIFSGFFVGFSGSSSQYVNFMVTSAVADGNYFSVSPEVITVSSDATSASFTITSSVDWTIEAPDFLTFDSKSGNGNKTVDFTFAENKTDLAVEAEIKVSTTSSDVAVKEYVIKFTQKSPAAGNSADFETLASNSSYSSYKTTGGWTLTNSNVLKGGDKDSNPVFVFIGKSDVTGEYAIAANINGKTSASGSIVSPTLSNGCGALSFSYGYAYSEKNGISFKVSIKQDGTVVKSFDVVDASASQKKKYTFSQEVNVSGDFTIEITNNSPSQKDSNADRYAFWDICWTSYTAE